MFEILASVLKYFFITIIYLFIFSIIRLIYFDIRTLNSQKAALNKSKAYLKLISLRETLDFRVSETYFLDRNQRIGRKQINEIALQDPYLSGLHAQITIIDGGYVLKDSGSTNGTYLNGERIQDTEMQLKDGDRIKVGQLEFLFVESSNEVGA